VGDSPRDAGAQMVGELAPRFSRLCSITSSPKSASKKVRFRLATMLCYRLRYRDLCDQQLKFKRRGWGTAAGWIA
jgi:hypothetical protein